MDSNSSASGIGTLANQPATLPAWLVAGIESNPAIKPAYETWTDPPEVLSTMKSSAEEDE
jgi:hypothetical protein